MSPDALSDTVTPAALGPYILAASTIHGPAAADDVSTHVSAVVKTGVRLLVAAQKAACDAVREIPIRSFQVTGTLSIENVRNPHRTQIGIDSGQSHYGADKMWTDYEDEEAAARTRAILRSLSGRTVTATKQTFFEYDHNGEVVITDKDEKQTRTRLAPGSLHLVDASGAKTPVDFAAPTRPTTDKPRFVDAAQTFGLLVERVGADRAAHAWGDLPRSGQVERSAAANAFSACTTSTARG